MPDQDDRRPDEGAVANAVVKVVLIAVAIGLVLGGGIFLAVKAAGLGDGGGSAVEDLPDGQASRSPLPTVALTPQARSSSPSASASADEESPSPSSSPSGELALSAGQSQVAPGERIDLTGQYPGKDGTVLVVQRRAGGSWGAFSDVTARVRGGSFSTYVITARSGDQRFRVLDQSDGTASNPVTVTVG